MRSCERGGKDKREKTTNPRGGGVPSAPLDRRVQRRRVPRYGEAPSAPLGGRSQGRRPRRDGGLVVTAFGSRRRRHDLISMGGDQNARGTSGMARHRVGTQLQTAGTPGGSATTIGTGKESCPIERERFCHGSSELFLRSPWFGGRKGRKSRFFERSVSTCLKFDPLYSYPITPRDKEVSTFVSRVSFLVSRASFFVSRFRTCISLFDNWEVRANWDISNRVGQCKILCKSDFQILWHTSQFEN